MLASIKKGAGWSIGLLFFLSAHSALAQSDEDSTFNAIDFFSGRIIPGFGGGFDQTSYDDRGGYQRFTTIPSLYGSISRKLGIQISHETEWPKDNLLTQTRGDSTFTSVQRLEPFRSNTSRMHLQWRPIPALRVFVSGERARSDQSRDEAIVRPGRFNSIYTVETEGSSKQFSLNGSYLSRQGKLTLKPPHLAWAYYGNLAIPKGLFATDVQFLQQGQIMATYSSDLSSVHTNQISVRQDSFSTIERTIEYTNNGETRTLPITLNLLYGLENNMMLGVALAASDYKQELISRTNEKTPGFSKIDIGSSSRDNRSIGLGSYVDFLSSDRNFHRLKFSLRKNREEIDVLSINSGSVVYKNGYFSDRRSWNIGYAFHRLWNVTPPSLPAYLANWNNDFGNRLPAGGFHFRGEISLEGDNQRSENSNLNGQSTIENESRSMEVLFAPRFGVFDWLSLMWSTQLYRRWIRAARSTQNGILDPNFKDDWGNTQTWSNNFVAEFANYRYSERLRPHFGWYDMSAFNQLYGPLLLPGMVNATVTYQANSAYAETWITDHLDYLDFRFPDHWNKKSWRLNTRFRFGLIGNLQITAQRSFSGNSMSDSRDDNIDATVSWQPWPSVRLVINHTFDADQNDFQRNFWNFKVLTLF
jgi:hypothetical protein